jgi:DNA-binding CsgD family transcriptional regulator
MLQVSVPPQFPNCAMAALTVLDQLDIPIVLLRANRTVTLANAAARRIEARGDCIRFSGDRLALVDSRDHRALETFLGRSLKPVALPRPRLCLGNRDMAARACLVAVEWLDRTESGGDPVAILLAHEFRVTIDPGLISDRYGLTRTEARLVAALFVNPVLRSAAERCSITLNTAKTHLKHVFTKCDVGSKAELLRLVALMPRTVQAACLSDHPVHSR